jgi:hypothetical protein
MTARDRAPEGIVRSTVRALLAQRRALPIGLVVLPLAVIQDAYSRDAYAVPIALLMCASFVLVGPALWRALFPMDRALTPRMPAAVRALLYAGVGAAVVLGIGRGLTQLVGATSSFLTTRPSLGVCVALFWVGGWGLARDIDLEEHLRRERARAELLAREAEHAQLLALKSHLDPHFLFNTLNAIAEWCREDGVVAERAILQLSSMLRTMLGGIHTPTWPLAKEIELVDALLSLHAVRDPSAFTVRREIAADLPAVEVPTMVLLPLAENAMKHGPLARNRGEIGFSIAAGADGVTVTLSNPGAYTGPRDGGSGLPIVRKRLALTYGDRASLSVRGQGDRCVATVVLPFL